MARAATSTPRTASRVSSGEGSVLARGARVRGRISGEGDLRIEGEVEGDVTVSGDLTIEEGASVTGDVGAASLIVNGALKGDVDARGPVAVRAGANVEGDLSGSEVSLEEGAAFRGRIAADFELPPELVQQAAAPSRHASRR
jgi:cytoskeletal protein CcmA (bactofilin family)